jgi:hypothetical protein
MGAGYVVTAGLAVVLGLWSAYNYGFPDNKFVNQDLPAMAFGAPQRAANSLSLTDSIQKVQDYAPLERLLKSQPVPRMLYWSLAGLAAVLVLSALRLRFTWWPIHPIFVLVWGSAYSGMYAVSVMLGWAIKAAVTQLGGGALYNRLKPLMIGIIAGDLLGNLLYMAVRVAYYALTGVPAG